MTELAGMFELHIVTLAANLLPASRFQAPDDLLAVHWLSFYLSFYVRGHAK